jgi:type IV secretion system protein VirB5
MATYPIRYVLAFLVMSAALIPCARAQWAVIDVPAIVQLVQEVQTMQQQLQTTRDQLQQARQALQSMTGDRGMASLLSGTSRNYLPSSWAEFTGAMRGGSAGYAGLSADVRNAISVNTVLSPQRFATLSVAGQQQIVAARQASALQQALTQEALANASGRFASMQTLVTAISSAGDQKAILDLHARISAELGMLQNEQTKLQLLYQATLAQNSVMKQQEREQVIAGHGRFESRFKPAP